MLDCPKCGSAVVYKGFSTVECSTVGCDNGPEKEKFDWRTFLMTHITHELQIIRLQDYVKKYRHTNPYPRVADVKRILDLTKDVP